jgi:glucose-6-phosphate isomerase
MEQYIQDGLRQVFEVVYNIEKVKHDMIIRAGKDNVDGFNFLAKKTMDFVNKKPLKEQP